MDVAIRSETRPPTPSHSRSAKWPLGAARLRPIVSIPLLAVVPGVLISGCDDVVPTAQPEVTLGKQDAPAMAHGSRQPALPASVASLATNAPAMVHRLFEEVKRLNAGCVAAGGYMISQSDPVRLGMAGMGSDAIAQAT